MKKILFIIPYIPYPLDSGGNQAFFNMVNYIRNRMSVSILLCSKSEEHEKYSGPEKIVGKCRFFCI